MAKRAASQLEYVCHECGHRSPRWLGRCPRCDGWNTFDELIEPRVSASASRGELAKPIAIGEARSAVQPRIVTGIDEFDRVLGGGLVQGMAVLIGGDPGIGKSTLLMQALASLCARDHACLYVTGEESENQVALRAQRLDAKGVEKVELLATTDMPTAAAAIGSAKYAAVVLDSIQTLSTPEIASAPGTVGQLRAVTSDAIALAKSKGVALFLIGHITKDGAIAGPKVLEHLVDTVLSFEGDRDHGHRVLRSSKNRFGPAHELGVFEMRDTGLIAVADPSGMFLQERLEGASGSVVVPTANGSRPMLLELQALVVSAAYGAARRIGSGVDANRLSVLLAVLEKRAGLHVLDHDVFASIAGGIAVSERALDLGWLLAIASSFLERPMPKRSVAFGEVGLLGEVRAVERATERIEEAVKLGFERVFLPRHNLEKMRNKPKGAELVGITTVQEAVSVLS
ncbi:MAG: DNA repair protein RadA [Polyangiales bacterium]